MAEQTLDEDVTLILDPPEYAELSLTDVTVEYGDPVPPRITEEIQRQESVTTEPVLRLPTGPLVESRRADVVVRYAPEGR